MHVAGLENSMFVGTQAFVGMPVFVGTQAFVGTPVFAGTQTWAGHSGPTTVCRLALRSFAPHCYYCSSRKVGT